MTVNTEVTEKETAKVERLIEAAKEASKKAYCEYSKFRVGAALIAASGQIYQGCNVENASYGLTMCAERNAIFAMVQGEGSGSRNFPIIVVFTPTASPASPCGACRQVMNEFSPHARVISVCDGPAALDSSVAELLPGAFGPGSLIAQ